MKLTKTDKQILLNVGYLDEDMNQIERATTKTKYTLVDGDTEIKIPQTEAMELLGREMYLRALGRSAFHWNTSREVEGTNKRVRFDSSALFR